MLQQGASNAEKFDYVSTIGKIYWIFKYWLKEKFPNWSYIKKNVRATLFLELYLFLQHLHFKIVFILKNLILIVNISTLFSILFLKF